MNPLPHFFGPAPTPLFGWLHPGSASSDLGVVVCAPLGQEMSNSYRTQQALAQALAAQGLPTLRFDCAGCGNASDRATTEGELPHWQDAVAQAIDHVCQRTGVRRVVVVALRAGVLIAAPVAIQHAAVCALVALAPVASGRRLLREWRAQASTAALRSGCDDGTLEVAGTAFSAATCAQLGAIDLSAQAWPAGKALHIIDRDTLPAAGPWLSRLASDAAPFSAEQQPGLDDMLLEAQHQRVPAQAVESVVGFVRTLAEPPASGSAAGAPIAMPAQAPATGLPTDTTHPGNRHPSSDALWTEVAPGVQERVQWFAGDRGARLFAIVAQPGGAGARLRRAAFGPAPSGGAPRPHTVLLPNTGPVHHIGGHRLYVMLARRLAADGHRVIRLDLSGLGDSPARAGEPPDAVYGRHAVDDLALALQAVQAQWPRAPVAVLGLCSGAYHALRLAVEHPGVARAFIINPLVYHWREGMTLQGHELQLQAAYYRGKWRRWDSWRRLLSGQSDLRLLARVAGQRLLRAALAALRPSTDPAGRSDRSSRPDEGDLTADLARAAAHGTQLQFIFAQGEPGWPALQDQAGGLLQRLQRQRRASVAHLSPADHTFTTAQARSLLLNEVVQALGGSAAASLQRQAPAHAAAEAMPQPPAAPAPRPARVD